MRRHRHRWLLAERINTRDERASHGVLVYVCRGVRECNASRVVSPFTGRYATAVLEWRSLGPFFRVRTGRVRPPLAGVLAS